MPTPYQTAFGAALAALPGSAGAADRTGPRVSSNVPISTSVSSTAPAVQPVDPAIPWNWPTLGPNQISREQFQFCDTQPASALPGVPFTAGLGSFSEAYQNFLSLIDTAKFQPLAILNRAIQAATPPTISPATGAGPAGWLVVPDSGQKDAFRPEWSVTLTPSQWQRDLGQPLTASLSTGAGFATGSVHAPSLDAALRDAAVSAEEVVRVLVRPGVWYSDSMVRLATLGPFLGMRTPAQVVGSQGILRCCITEFFVARGLSSSATLNPTDEQLLRSHLSASSDARLGPLSAASATLSVAPVAGVLRATLSSSPNMPFIVGVSVIPIV